MNMVREILCVGCAGVAFAAVGCSGAEQAPEQSGVEPAGDNASEGAPSADTSSQLVTGPNQVEPNLVAALELDGEEFNVDESGQWATLEVLVRHDSGAASASFRIGANRGRQNVTIEVPIEIEVTSLAGHVEDFRGVPEKSYAAATLPGGIYLSQVGQLKIVASSQKVVKTDVYARLRELETGAEIELSGTITAPVHFACLVSTENSDLLTRIDASANPTCDSIRAALGGVEPQP